MPDGELHLSRKIVTYPKANTFDRTLRSAQRNKERHGVSGESISARLDLQVGSHRWVSQRVAVMNLDELSDILGVRHIDGLIGEDILRDFRSIRIDYHARVIELEE